jgi:hypothetical protein
MGWFGNMWGKRKRFPSVFCGDYSGGNVGFNKMKQGQRVRMEATFFP